MTGAGGLGDSRSRSADTCWILHFVYSGSFGHSSPLISSLPHYLALTSQRVQFRLRTAPFH